MCGVQGRKELAGGNVDVWSLGELLLYGLKARCLFFGGWEGDVVQTVPPPPTPSTHLTTPPNPPPTSSPTSHTQGLAAYADHARILGQEDERVYAFIHEAMAVRKCVRCVCFI